MHRLRFTLLPIAVTALVVAFGLTVPSLGVAAKHHSGPHLLVPGRSIGPVHLGEREADVHLGPADNNGPGSVFYPHYSIAVAYNHGRAVGIVIDDEAVDPSELVSPGQYQTRSHPTVNIGVAMGHVSSAYPQAQCAHHVIPANPPQDSENCLLRSHHNHTFFAGGSEKPGQTIRLAAIDVSTAGFGPRHP